MFMSFIFNPAWRCNAINRILRLKLSTFPCTVVAFWLRFSHLGLQSGGPHVFGDQAITCSNGGDKIALYTNVKISHLRVCHSAYLNPALQTNYLNVFVWRGLVEIKVPKELWGSLLSLDVIVSSPPQKYLITQIAEQPGIGLSRPEVQKVGQFDEQCHHYKSLSVPHAIKQALIFLKTLKVFLKSWQSSMLAAAQKIVFYVVLTMYQLNYIKRMLWWQSFEWPVYLHIQQLQERNILPPVLRPLSRSRIYLLS